MQQVSQPDIREQVSANSESTLNLRTELHAWNLLSAEQKTASLQNVVHVAAHDAVSNLLKATSPLNDEHVSSADQRS